MPVRARRRAGRQVTAAPPFEHATARLDMARRTEPGPYPQGQRTQRIHVWVCGRHAFGALLFTQSNVRPKPAVPWGPEAARRVLSAMVAAVRPPPPAALCAPRALLPRGSSVNRAFRRAVRTGWARALGAGGAGPAPAARPGGRGRRSADLGARVGGDQLRRGPGSCAGACALGPRSRVAVDGAARGVRGSRRGVGPAAAEYAAGGSGRRVRGEPAGQVRGARRRPPARRAPLAAAAAKSLWRLGRT